MEYTSGGPSAGRTPAVPGRVQLASLCSDRVHTYRTRSCSFTLSPLHPLSDLRFVLQFAGEGRDLAVGGYRDGVVERSLAVGGAIVDRSAAAGCLAAEIVVALEGADRFVEALGPLHGGFHCCAVCRHIKVDVRVA